MDFFCPTNSMIDSCYFYDDAMLALFLAVTTGFFEIVLRATGFLWNFPDFVDLESFFLTFDRDLDSTDRGWQGFFVRTEIDECENFGTLLFGF